MNEHLNELLHEADAQLDSLVVHDASASEVSAAMNEWLKPRVGVAVSLDYAVEGETPGLLGRREI